MSYYICEARAYLGIVVTLWVRATHVFYLLGVAFFSFFGAVVDSRRRFAGLYTMKIRT